MSTWILIVTFSSGTAYGFEYAISGLPSYAECSRISKLIPENKYGGTKEFKCIEVLK